MWLPNIQKLELQLAQKREHGSSGLGQLTVRMPNLHSRWKTHLSPGIPVGPWDVAFCYHGDARRVCHPYHAGAVLYHKSESVPLLTCWQYVTFKHPCSVKVL